MLPSERMNALVKVQRKGQLTIPSRLRTQVGLSDGDYVEARAEHGRIVLIPHACPIRGADDEYTPAQRKVIDARLAEADEDVRHGRVYGPFSAPEAVRFLRGELRDRGKKKKKTG